MNLEDKIIPSNLNALKRKRENIEDKINRLVDFVKNYPILWYDRRNGKKYLDKIKEKDERDELNKKFETALSDYKYIYTREIYHKLSEEQRDKLITGEVGGIFANIQKNKEDKESIASHYGIDESVLNLIIKKYGSIEFFKEIYIEELINAPEESMISSNLSKNLTLISNFDVSSPDLISRNIGYINFIKDLFELSDDVVVVDEKKIIRIINDKLKNMPAKNAEILQTYYGIDGKERNSLTNLGKDYSVSKQNIENIKNRGISFFKHNASYNQLKQQVFKLEGNKKEAFLRKYFESNDVFYSQESKEIDEALRMELLEDLYFSKIFEESGLKDLEQEGLEEPKFIDSKFFHKNTLQIANQIVGKVDEMIQNNEYLIPSSKENIYRMFYKNTMLIRLMLERENPINGMSQNDGLKKYFKDVEKIINETYESDETRKDDFLQILNEKKKYLSDKNREYLIGRIEESRNYEKLEDLNKDTQILDMSISDLNLSTRTYNILIRMGIKTIRDWELRTAENKMNYSGMGKKSYDEIQEQIQKQKSNDLNDEIDSEEIGIKGEEPNIFNKLNSIEQEIKDRFLDEESREYLLQMINKKRENYDELLNSQEQDIINEIQNIKQSLEDDSLKETFSKESIDKLNFSTRISNRLVRAGIKKISDWSGLSEFQQMDIRNFGKKSCEEVRKIIEIKWIDFVNKKINHIGEIIDASSLSTDIKNELHTRLEEIPTKDLKFQKENSKDNQPKLENIAIIENKENSEMEESLTMDEELKMAINNLKKAYSRFRDENQNLQDLKAKKENMKNMIDQIFQDEDQK